MSELSTVKRAFLRIEEMERELEEARGGSREPLAIVGIGCRFPGAATPDEFWQLLHDGVDAVTEIPADRWDIDAYYDPDPDAPGRMSTRWGAFLDRIDGFDPQFFGIAPREAEAMDPQQRLLLEVVWEALEHAAIAPDRLAGSRTGVFMGLCKSDYLQLQLRLDDPTRYDIYYASGIAHSILSGRLSYLLGLQGPSLTLDTACSSSLVALHLACQSLRNGESDMALAGGVNLVLSPENTISFSKSAMLAADGRCKTFDARADGFVQGEGAAVVVVKRLADALESNDRVLALIRGTAVNQDGPSSGLTAPNGPSQTAVIREALAAGNVKPEEVGYVDAHGTATSLGDPVEVQALAAALRENRDTDRPLLIGSLKTNLGHLEGAAGIAGLVKVVLSLGHREIPAHLHFEEPNPHIPWNRLPVEVVRERRNWEPIGGRRLAGVSAFGFSGTNAHVVLEEAPEADPVDSTGERPMHLLVLSAHDETALSETARRYAAQLTERPDQRLQDFCHTANCGRAASRHRLALIATDAGAAARDLAACAAGETPAGVERGILESTDRPKIAYLFTGQGSQYLDMGRQLFETQPTFRRAIETCDEILRDRLDRSLARALYPQTPDADAAARLDQTALTQPALFSVEYALAELWRSWGIEPALVMGHSVGEYAAACVAGVFSVEDGLALIAERGRLMQELPPGGCMAVLFAGEERVREALRGREASVSIAAINGPQNVVISGAAQEVEALVRSLAAEGVAGTPLQVSHAFHSPLMQPMAEAFAGATQKVTFAHPRRALISNVNARVVSGDEIASPEYWQRHVHAPVRFADSIETLHRENCDVFVEVGPAPVLVGMGRRCAPAARGLWLPSLSRGDDDWRTVLETLAALATHGAAVDWEGFDRDYSCRKISLPTYPFQRRRYWFREPEHGRESMRIAPNRAGAHPLLPRRVASPLETVLFEAELSAETLPFLADHVVHDALVMPAAAYLELGTAAGRECLGVPRVEAFDVVIDEALTLSADGARSMQVVAEPHDADSWRIRVFSREAGVDDASWTLHASARLRASDTAAPGESSDDALAKATERCDKPVEIEAFYRALRERGLAFRSGFRGVSRLSRCDGEALGEVRLADEYRAEGPQYGVHPALLDSCLQVLAAAFPGFDPADTESPIYMPIGIDRFEMFEAAGERLISHARLEPGRDDQNETRTGHFTLFDREGRRVGAIDGLHMKRVDPGALQPGTADETDRWLYEVAWRQGAASTAAELDSPPIPPADPARIAAAIESRAGELRQEHGASVYDTLHGDLDDLCSAYIVQALRELGWDFEIGARVAVDILASRLGIAERHRRLLARLLDILDEDKILERDSDGWRVVRDPAPCDPETVVDGLLERYAGQDAEILLTRRCGSKLAAALRDEIDPLQLLFAGDDPGSAVHVYDTPLSRTFNGLAAEALRSTLSEIPSERTVRVLEIGAGTGGTTVHLLPELDERRAEYTFTDLGQKFLADAELRFRDRPWVQCRPLDIERDPIVQGFTPHQFDVVVAANVLHATEDLQKAVEHARRLLAPGGLLILLEGTTPLRWYDLTFGLTEGWWRFTDAGARVAHPLVDRPTWCRVLGAAGLEEACALPLDAEGAMGDLSLFLARNDTDTKGGVASEIEEWGTWLVFADEGGVAESLARKLDERAQEAILIRPGESFRELDRRRFELNLENPDDFRQLLATTLQQDRPPCRGVIYLGSLDQRDEHCAAALHLVQALVSGRDSDPPRVWFVTRGAQHVASTHHEVDVDVDSAPLWGLSNVIAVEHPELRCTSIDLDPSGTQDAAALLFSELGSQCREDRIAYRDGARHVARLVRAGLPSAAGGAEGEGEPDPVELVLTKPGVLEGIDLQPVGRHAPGLGEVEIRVRATGLNFRDVLNALAMRDDHEPLGGECSGTVTRVGEGVTDLSVGMDVLAVTRGGFSTYVTATADLVLPKPERLSFADAAGASLALLTAHYALNEIGNIARGQRVLIHAAAGGVGMAAVQIARRAGAEIFATAGSSEKRAFLRSTGIEHVMDSRTLDFVDHVRDATRGEGVDLVLNSLTGEAIPGSLGLLRRGGRFLEIGKSELWEATQVAAVNDKASYHAIDLAERIRNDAASVRPMFVELLQAIEQGLLSPLPVTRFRLDQAPEAFRYMAQARHIGKVVLTQRDAGSSGSSVEVHENATYLITGGLSGLGLLVAEWLVIRGARHLVLAARGDASPAASKTLGHLRERGASVVTVRADVTRPADLKLLFAQIDDSMPPLRGVIHSAGVLDDGMLIRQDRARFAAVMAPKVQGARLLHEATRERRLDFFVLFSSMASLVPRSGQGSHAAANAFLDALAHKRRAAGLPAMSLNWGAWSGTGAAVDHDIVDRIAERGIGAIDPIRGLHVLERAMIAAPPQLAIAPIDWPRFLECQVEGEPSPFLSELAAGRRSNGRDVNRSRQPIVTSDILRRLEEALPSQRRSLLQEHVQDCTVRILGLDPELAVNRRQPLSEMGLDSLMAVEIRNALGGSFELVLPATLLFDYPTIDTLTAYLYTELGVNESQASPAESPAVSDEDDLLAKIEGMSDDEVDDVFGTQLTGERSE